MSNEQNPKRSEDDIWQEAFESGDYTQASKPTPTDAIEDEQQDYLLDISRFAVNNQYKSESLKNETARYIIDLPKVIEYIKSQYKLIKK